MFWPRLCGGMNSQMCIHLLKWVVYALQPYYHVSLSLSLCNCWPTVLADSVWSHPALALDIAQTSESSNVNCQPQFLTLFIKVFSMDLNADVTLLIVPSERVNLLVPLCCLFILPFLIENQNRTESKLCEWILNMCHLDRLRYGVGVCQCGLQGRADCSTGTVGEGATRQHTGAG